MSPGDGPCGKARADVTQSEIIEALLAQAEPPGLTAQELALYHYAVELNRERSVRDATYATALAQLGARAIVELTALIGYYTMVAMTLNCHEIPLPEGVEPAFPLPQHAIAP